MLISDQPPGSKDPENALKVRPFLDPLWRVLCDRYGHCNSHRLKSSAVCIQNSYEFWIKNHQNWWFLDQSPYQDVHPLDWPMAKRGHFCDPLGGSLRTPWDGDTRLALRFDHLKAPNQVQKLGPGPPKKFPIAKFPLVEISYHLFSMNS